MVLFNETLLDLNDTDLVRINELYELTMQMNLYTKEVDILDAQQALLIGKSTAMFII